MTLLRTYRLSLLTTISILLSSLVVLASPHVGISPSPDWKLPVKAGGRPPSAKEFTAGYYNALIDLQTHAERRAYYTHVVREIKTTEGVQNGSQISVYFNPAYEQLTFHNVTLYRGGQAIEKLRTNAFKVVPVETERDRFIYNDSYVATLLLDDVRPGDRIDYDFTLTGANPVLGGRFTSDFYFSSADLLPHLHQVLIVSPSRKLTFRDFNKPPQPHVATQSGLKIYEWNAHNVKSANQEPHEPSWSNTEAHVQISEYAGWQDVVNWALPMYTVQAPTAQLLAQIADWKRRANGNKLKYTQLAVEFVQNDIRYMGIEIGTYSHRPHNPTEVVRQRYGDCKDKSLLLCTLLQANQIDAYPALINTYARSQTPRFLPSPTVFNHAVVWLQINNATYWIDPTIAHQRGVDGEFNMPSYGTALVLRPGETALQTVTSPRRGTIDITETFVVPSPRTSEGRGKLRVTSIYTFNHADDIRGQLANSSLTTLEESYLDFYKENYKQHPVELLDSLRIEDDTIANVVMSHEGYSMANVWEVDSATGLATFSVFGRTFYDNLIKLPADKRHQPVALSFPYEMDYAIKLKLPEIWPVTVDQWAVKRDAYEMSFSRFYDPADSTISFYYHYKTYADHLPVGMVDTYRADIKKITDQLEYQLSYNTQVGSQEGHMHPGSVVFFLLALLGSSYLCWRWFHYSPTTISDSVAPWPIGGWLILLALGVLLTPLVLIQQLITSPAYLDAGTWTTLKTASSLKMGFRQVCVYTEGVLNVLLFCYSVLCAVLFVQRRNTFPLLYSLFLGGRIAFLLIDAVVFGAFFDINVGPETYTSIGQSITAAAIWIPYLHKSSRVRHTFVKPFLPVTDSEEQDETYVSSDIGPVASPIETDSKEPNASVE